MRAGLLPEGPVAVAVHEGPLDELSETYAAIEAWIEDNELHGNGAPWESYITGPQDVPDSSQWRTEVFWPIAE